MLTRCENIDGVSQILLQDDCLITEPFSNKQVSEAEIQMVNSGIAVGINKGHVVTKKDRTERPAARKGVSRFKISLRVQLEGYAQLYENRLTSSLNRLVKSRLCVVSFPDIIFAR